MSRGEARTDRFQSAGIYIRVDGKAGEARSAQLSGRFKPGGWSGTKKMRQTDRRRTQRERKSESIQCPRRKKRGGSAGSDLYPAALGTDIFYAREIALSYRITV